MDAVDQLIAQLYGFDSLAVGTFSDNPARDADSTERLMRYWAEDPDHKIRWHEPCPFCRCLEHLGKYFPSDTAGLCNHLEQRALGHAPNAGPFHSNKKHCPC